MEEASLSQSRAAGPAAKHWPLRASIAAALVAGAIVRLWMLRHFLETNGDTQVYGDIARNLLLHGRYALTLGSGQTFATLIRLPGYPFFLAACFALFGIGNYVAVAVLQIVMELAGCLLLADVSRRVAAPAGWAAAAAQATLWLGVLCPFTAIYAANPLTECPTLFALALMLWSACGFQRQATWRMALAFTFAVTFAALLRPDGALAGVAFAPALFCHAEGHSSPPGTRRLISISMVCAVLALTPFAAWTLRNWHVFHVIEPLAPRSATDPGDPLTPGWDRWVATWCLDFASTYEVVWNVPGDVLDLSKLPSRAFDTHQQYVDTATIAAAYNANKYDLNPTIDAGFARLADERTAVHPLRTYLWLPVARVVDMWLRPRVENLPIDVDWWVWANHHAETEFSWAYAALNLLYLVLGCAGLLLRPRLAGWMLAYMLLRSALLLSVIPPEARYTLECFPMIFVLGGVALGRLVRPPGSESSY